ncbi:MAG: hypothetical protein PVH73_01615 [Candidatus Bathyarchaeota archaeon]
MVKTSEATCVRISNRAKKIIERYACMKGWSLAEFNEQLAFTLSSGLDLLNEESVNVETLRKFYPRASLVVFEDVATIFEPVKNR